MASLATVTVLPIASMADENLETIRHLGNLVPFATTSETCSSEQLYSLASVLNGMYDRAMFYRKKQGQSKQYVSCLNEIVQAEKLRPELREMVLQITEEYEHRDKYPDMVSGWMAGYELIREDISHYFSAKDLALGEYSK
jgi:hypothetical protein